MLEPDFTAGLSQGIRGAAMDYLVSPGPKARVFENRASFSVHVRHHLLNSPELPSIKTIEKLWKKFEASHESVHERK